MSLSKERINIPLFRNIDSLLLKLCPFYELIICLNYLISNSAGMLILQIRRPYKEDKENVLDFSEE